MDSPCCGAYLVEGMSNWSCPNCRQTYPFGYFAAIRRREQEQNEQGGEAGDFQKVEKVLAERTLQQKKSR